MVKSQENDTTILLGLKGFEVGIIDEGEKKILVEVKSKHYQLIFYLSLFL